MKDRPIARVILCDGGKQPLVASAQFSYKETKNGVIMRHGLSSVLIPWHRIREVEYVRG